MHVSETVLAFGTIGTMEIVIIAAIVLLIFGRRLPSIARSFGQSLVEFRRAVRPIKDKPRTDSEQALPDVGGHVDNLGKEDPS